MPFMNPVTAKKILEETERGYDLIAEKFSATRKNFWKELAFIKKYTSKKARVLDYGCGNGRLLEILPSSIEYYGIDVSQKLLQLAKQHYTTKASSKISFQKILPAATTLNLPFSPNFFNVIYSIAVFHHLPSKKLRQNILQEFNRVLSPQGYLIITVWNLWQPKYLSNIFQNWQKKILGKSELDWNDCYINFTDNQKNTFPRYHHAFTKRELNKLIKKADFHIIKTETIKSRNLIVIAEKKNQN